MKGRVVESLVNSVKVKWIILHFHSDVFLRATVYHKQQAFQMSRCPRSEMCFSLENRVSGTTSSIAKLDKQHRKNQKMQFNTHNFTFGTGGINKTCSLQVE